MGITLISLNDDQSQWISLWKQFGQNLPFLHPDWHKTWKDTLGISNEPLYLLYNDVLFPFIKSDDVVYFSGGTEIADYLDCIGTETSKPDAWSHVLQYLSSIGICSIDLHNIPELSGTMSFFRSFQTSRQFQNLPVIQKEDVTPILTLPDSWDAYLNSLTRKNRHELKRKIQKFEREYPSYIIQNNDTSGLPILLSLMKQNPDKNDFLTDVMQEFFQTITHTFKESIDFLELTDGNHVIASVMSFNTNNTVFLYNSGYMYDIKGSGLYLKAKSIERAIQNGKTSYNFLQGNERYKYELGARDSFVYSITYTI